MFNYKIVIEYDGSNYCGWQLQKNQHKKSLQEVIERALRKIFREEIRLIASGRTDAGVHAKAQVANFKATKRVLLNKLQRSLNGLLREDIRVTKVGLASPGFHSRFDAKSKIYRYTILNRPYASALLRNHVYFYPYPLDLKLMQNELKALVGRHDFKSFAASDKKKRRSIRTITMAKAARSGNQINIDIEADGFLYNMVRNIVGTLIEIGRHKLGKGSLKKILLSKDRTLAGPTAQAKGLCLMRVKY